MKKLLLVIPLMFLLALSLPGHAFTDTPPVVAISAPKIVDTDATILFSAVDTGYMSGLVYIDLLEDGKSIGARVYCNMMNQCSGTFTVHHELKGGHSYSALAVDRGGNKKLEIASVSFLGHDQPPLITLSDNHPAIYENQRINIIVLTSDKNKYPVTVTTTRLPGGSNFDGTYFTWTPNYTQSGDYYITFTATNSKNLAASATLHVTVNNVDLPPQLVSVSPFNNQVRTQEGQKVTFSINGTDPDKYFSIQWLLDNQAVGSSKTYTYKPDYNAAGFHVLVGRVYDSDYSYRYVWNINVDNVNRPPVMEQLAPKTVKAGTTLKFTVHANDLDKNPLNYTVDGLPTNARFDPDTRTFQWTPAYGQAGVYDVTFHASDPQHYMSSADVAITVTQDDINPDYQKLYDLYYGLSQQTKDPAQVTQGNSYTNGNTVTNAKNITTGQTCMPGYLCSSVTYFLGG